MTTTQKITISVLAATIAILIGYDIWAVIHGGTHGTISWVVWQYSHDYPVIPFLVGGLCGHFFFSQGSTNG